MSGITNGLEKSFSGMKLFDEKEAIGKILNWIICTVAWIIWGLILDTSVYNLSKSIICWTKWKLLTFKSAVVDSFNLPGSHKQAMYGLA